MRLLLLQDKTPASAELEREPEDPPCPVGSLLDQIFR